MNLFLLASWPPVLFLGLVVLPMLLELQLSVRNERQLRSAGAVEPEDDVYRPMAVMYPGAFIAMILEGAVRGAAIDAWFWSGVTVFGAAKALKYWAIASLGPRWTFRVLVPPRSARVTRGPYQWMAHPNYLAVAGELAGVALAMRALLTGPVSLVTFGYLIICRVRVERTALDINE